MANRTRILQIVGVGAALVSGYLLYRYFQDRKAEVTTKEYQLKELDDAKMNEAIDELREVLTDKALHLQEDIIDRIFRKSTDIIKDSYADLTIHYRKRNCGLSQANGRLRTRWRKSSSSSNTRPRSRS